MSFTLYPDPSAGPLPVAPGETVFTPFAQRSGHVAELDPPYPQVMFVRLAMLGGSSAPRLLVAAGAGTPVEVSVDPQGVFRSPGEQDYVGDVSLNMLAPTVFEIVVGLVSAGTVPAWRLGIRNTDAMKRLFTWVVADSETDTAQPWVQPGPVDYQVTATIPVGAVPYLMALDTARRSAYTNDDRSLAVIDLSGRTVVDRVPIPFPPIDIAVDAATHTVYFSNTQAGAIAAIDPSTGAVSLISIPPQGAAGLAVDPDRRTLYSWGFDLGTGSGMFAVQMIDADARTVTTVPVGQFSGAFLAIESATGLVYATGIEPDALLVFDPASRAVTAAIPVGKPTLRIALDPIRHLAYVSCPTDNAVLMVDQRTQAVTPIPVGKMPSHLAMDADVYTLYVANRLDSTVTAIDTRSGAQTTIPVGEGAQGVAIDPLTHTVITADTKAGTASVIERRR